MKNIETSRRGLLLLLFQILFCKIVRVINGACYIDNFRVVHKRATNKTDRNEFKGSNDINEIYSILSRWINGSILRYTIPKAVLNSFI